MGRNENRLSPVPETGRLTSPWQNYAVNGPDSLPIPTFTLAVNHWQLRLPPFLPRATRHPNVSPPAQGFALSTSLVCISVERIGRHQLKILERRMSSTNELETPPRALLRNVFGAVTASRGSRPLSPIVQAAK